MPEVEQQRPERPSGEFARLAEFAQRRSAPAAPELIRVLGTQRLHRRRAGQAVLGTGALAAVVFLGAGFVQNVPGHTSDTLGPGAPTSRAATSSSPAAKASETVGQSAPVQYLLPEFVTESSGNAVLNALQASGFTHVSTKSVPSDTVPQGNAVDIENAEGQSMLNREVSVDTRLVVVVSAGPSTN